ncbi:heme-containing CO-sensing transcriptional regulator rcoM 2 [Paraburkholderia xenovorans LB400]|uniref:Heme-containing CO-sensing transcriptional regulator RcoM 2 n=1 Tax=Paraburkholderia xenovorans (strain LB400) TaxID=266265 RepID=RCOM2_PARXL|nr:heme-containing CO-sensing transcriptional regulator RcoM [Paraburkholderia xenovorans]Q13IY4.1 RecName: Full=Heme-containing CO-sensing transcriptional regulator RcoM 2; AltName: Full=Regulator of CO metabolism 2; Short=RCOM-2 [Paraburkholderia xenovorans LB400]ABE35955.1 Transcriptional regulator, LytR/AlgR family [Paraburkholderia xenovorans LB400]AIP34012.1 heme-containing CO-sensing transcriptional regulator rcoM 2 [Paraburkholderia xenovorans LB400]
MKSSESAAATASERRAETFQHKLEQFNPGIVWLDPQGHVSAFNDVALHILGPAGEQSLGVAQDHLFGIDVVQLHPEKSRDKLRFLLQSRDAGGCPVRSPPPVAMMINIPDRILMIKVSKMTGAAGTCGSCMIFYDVTDLTTEPSSQPAGASVPAPRRLFKIPVYRKSRVILIDLKDIVRFQGDGHYTTIVTKDERYLSNLSLADLELRLDSSVYLRVHRSHIVSLPYAVELVKLDESVNLVMDDAEQTQVPVSRSRTAQLKELLGVV